MNIIKKTILFITVVILNFNASCQNVYYDWAKQFTSIQQWSTPYANGTAIVVDSFENTYTTGYYHSGLDIDPGVGTLTFSCNGTTDIFLSKLDKLGNLVWARNSSGIGGAKSSSLALDHNGNIFVTGEYFGGMSVPTGNFANVTGTDAFLIKIDSAGNYKWAKHIGNSSWVEGKAVKTDAYGNVYLAGLFNDSADFDPGQGTHYMNGDFALFIAKYDSAGNYIWSKSIDHVANSNTDLIWLELDQSGNLFLSGIFQDSVDFDPEPTYSYIYSPSSGVYLSKFDTSGNFIWVKSIGYDATAVMTMDSTGSFYFNGNANQYTDFDPGPGQVYSAAGGGHFLAKWDSAGNFVWQKDLIVGAYSIISDQSANIYCIGEFTGTADFDPGPGTYSVTSSGSNDIVISKFDSMGNFNWAKLFSAPGQHSGYSIALDQHLNVYTTGTFMGSNYDFDPGLGTAFMNSTFKSVFVSKLSQGCSAYFTVMPDIVPHNWLVVDRIQGATPVTYFWEWGDGNTSTGATPSHTYPVAGYYPICLTITDSNNCVSTYCDSSTYLFRAEAGMGIVNIQAMPSSAVGVDELNISHDINLYPNPARQTIFIRNILRDSEIRITDIYGELVFFKLASENNLEVNISNFISGLYIIRVSNSKGTSTQKIIVE
jgi:hypothetical protein